MLAFVRQRDTKLGACPGEEKEQKLVKTVYKWASIANSVPVLEFFHHFCTQGLTISWNKVRNLFSCDLIGWVMSLATVKRKLGRNKRTTKRKWRFDCWKWAILWEEWTGWQAKLADFQGKVVIY